MNQLITLFLTFAKIGSVTFGGGYAMLPILEREIVNRHKWCTTEEIMNYFAIGQCTPGIIFVNTATFIGYKQKGILGGISATLGSVTPSILIIVSIASALSNFANIPIVDHAFSGISIMVAVLIINAVLTMGKKSISSPFYFFLAFLSFTMSINFQIPTVYIVLFFICFAIFYEVMENKKGRDGGGSRDE